MSVQFRGMREVISELKKIRGKYRIDEGIVVYGEESDGSEHPLLVDADGRLQVDIVAAIGSVDVSDRAGRLLGIVYGSQGEQLQQRATSFDLLVQLRNAGSEIDPRDRNWTITETVPVSATDLDIRDLAKTQDELYAVLRTDAGVAYDARDRNWTITETVSVDDDGGSLTVDGTVGITEIETDDLDSGAGTDTQAIIGIALEASGGHDLLKEGASDGSLLSDIADRAARLLGIAYGDVGQLLQRAATRDLIVQLRTGGATEYDARDRNWTISETVSVDDDGGSLTVDGTVAISEINTDDLDTGGGADTQAIIGLALAASGGHVLLNEGGVSNSILSDVADRAARLLGVVYGSQGQQLLQRATSYDLQAQLRNAGSEIDPRDRNWTITETVPVDSELPAAAALSDAKANPTVPDVGSFLHVLNPVAGDWDRARSVETGGGVTTGILGVGLYVFDGTDWERMRTGVADGMLPFTVPSVLLYGFSGGSRWDRLRTTEEGGGVTVGLLAVGNYVFDETDWERRITAQGLSETTAGAAVTLKSLHNDEIPVEPRLIMGYDDTGNANAYRAIAVSALGEIETKAGQSTPSELLKGKGSHDVTDFPCKWAGAFLANPSDKPAMVYVLDDGKRKIPISIRPHDTKIVSRIEAVPVGALGLEILNDGVEATITWWN